MANSSFHVATTAALTSAPFLKPAAPFSNLSVSGNQRVQRSVSPVFGLDSTFRPATHKSNRFMEGLASTDHALLETPPGAAGVAVAEPMSQGNGGDVEQAEALEILKLLSDRSGQDKRSSERIQELECSLYEERCGRREVETKFAQESGQREAAQQQIMCLEFELDGKEVELQRVEQDLQSCQTDLKRANLTVRLLQGERARTRHESIGPNVQLAEYQKQLELKDHRISQLYAALGQKVGSSMVEDAQTSYGSDDSVSAVTLDSHVFSLR